MSATILTACPYNGLQALQDTIRRHSDYVRVIDANDVAQLSMRSITLEDGEEISLEDIDCAFIRYPYDLIPPHTESFKKREETEFLKTIALLLESVSPNRASMAWAIRNRLYSLSLAKSFGVPVPPRSEVLRTPWRAAQAGDDDAVCKALGNCFFSWAATGIPEGLEGVLRVEEDDGEQAIVLPAQELTGAVHELVEILGLVLRQSLVHGTEELRVYVVGDEFYQYMRCRVDGVDQSGAAYLDTELHLPDDIQQSLWAFQQSTQLSYCCYDIVLDREGSPVVIDINPFGSLPPYEAFPDATDALASYIVGEALTRASHGPSHGRSA